MKGKECVAIASDLRYGVQLRTITTDFPKVFEINPHLWVGLPGLVTDIQTVCDKLKFRTSLYELKEGRKIKPKTFASMLSNMLYERRFGPFFVEPIVAGLDPVTKESYICAMDLIGSKTHPNDFVVGGTADEQLYGESRVASSSIQKLHLLVAMVLEHPGLTKTLLPLQECARPFGSKT